MALHLKIPAAKAGPDWRPAATRLARPRLVDDVIEEVEATPGGPVKVKRQVRRRARAAVLSKVSRSRLRAAEAYAVAFEEVQAGGAAPAGAASNFAAEKVDGGTGSNEGRQFGTVETVARLRRMEDAIGAGAVALDARGATASHLFVVRAVAVASTSLPRLLDALDVRRTARREAAIYRALDDALGRIAETIGLENRNTNGKNS